MEDSSLTVADVLALPVLAAGLPKVVAGHDRLGEQVRWVHVTEWDNPASALRGGELVLTTGIGFPAHLDAYAAELADVRAAAVVLELGRRYREAPVELVAGCRARHIPLVVLHRGVKFVDVTQEVHAIILGGRLRTLQAAQRIHDTFTALSLRGADAGEVVHATSAMTARPVVLENLAHQVMLCAPAERTVEDVLNLWERRSRATDSPAERTGVCGQEGWLVTSVEFRGQRWGRLIMLPADAERHYRTEHVVSLERAAGALTLARLTGDAAWEQRAHRETLRDIVEQRPLSWRDTRARLESLGVPCQARRFVVAVIEMAPLEATEHEQVLERMRDRLDGCGLVGDLGPRGLGVLLVFREPGEWRSPLTTLAEVAGAPVCVGTEVTELSQVARSAVDADHVAQSIVPGGPPAVYTLDDIGLPQLLYALREDPRVQAYAERQLAPLLDYDATHRTDLLASLRTYLHAAGNKSTAARRDHLSRQAFHQRIRLIEQVLSADLESGTDRAQLHVAIAALDAQRTG
jgi:purine catabolism regulator